MTAILDQIKKECDIGSRLELTLFEGAEYKNGWTPAPTVDPIGYAPSESMTDQPGLKVVGFVSEFMYSKYLKRTKIFLVPTWNLTIGSPEYELREFYIDEACIHSFSK